MPGRAKCLIGCDCEKHNRPRMSPDEARARQAEISRAYYAAHRNEILERARQTRKDPVAGERKRKSDQARADARSPEERERLNRMARERYRKKPRTQEETAAAHYRHRYGLTIEQRDQLALDQGGRCYLCSDPLPSKSQKIHTDHDRSCCPGNRSCGKCVRGLACEGCNTGIGSIGEDPKRLRRVADALEAANARVRSQVTLA